MIKDTERVFFELLRLGLWSDGRPDIRIDGATDWQDIYRLATEQSVLGLILAGLERSDVKPPKGLLLQWIGEVQIIEKQNKDMNAFIADLIDKLRKADIYALLVKGQGIAQCYEKPLWRCSGDIDLFLSDENYQKAKALLLPLGKITEPEEVAKKHFAMDIDGWAVELHGTLHVGLSTRVDRMLDNVQYDVFHRGEVRFVALDVNDNLNDNGTTKSFKSVQVFLPAENEDVVYVFAHILQHFYKGGIGLRQICDWCRLLWTYRESLNHEYLESKIREAGVMSEWKAFGAFAVELLGMPVEAMPLLDVRCKKDDGRCEIDANLRKKADKICKFILEVGNFGHNRDNSYFQKHSYFVQKCISAWRRVKDLCRHATIFPVNSVRFFFGIMHNGIVSAIRGE